MTTSREAKRQFALVLDVEDRSGGTPQIVGRFYYLGGDGQLLNPLGDRWEDGAEFADFVVSAYLGGLHGQDGTWGFQHDYRAPYRVDLARAESMTKMLRKVAKGLEKLQSERGYLAEDEFDQYVLRICEVLKIKTFYVRNSERGQAMSGQRWRATDGSGVKSWIADRARVTTSA